MRQDSNPVNAFVTVAQVHDIPPGTTRTVEVQGAWVALFNVEGTVYALDNACPHAGGPLGEGRLRDGGVVECPWHGWRFDVRTGLRVGNSHFEVPCYAVRIVGTEIQVSRPPEIT